MTRPEVCARRVQGAWKARGRRVVRIARRPQTRLEVRIARLEIFIPRLEVRIARLGIFIARLEVRIARQDCFTVKSIVKKSRRGGEKW